MLRRTATTPLGLFGHRIRRASERAATRGDAARLRGALETIERDARADAESLRALCGSSAYRQHPAVVQLAELEVSFGFDQEPTRVDIAAVEAPQTHGFGVSLFAGGGITPFSRVRELIQRTAGAGEAPQVKYVLCEDADARLYCWIGHIKDRKHYELPPKGTALAAAGTLYVDLHADRLAFDGSSSTFPTVFDTIFCDAAFAAAYGLRLAEQRSQRRAYAFFQERLGPAITVLPYSTASCLVSPPEYQHHPENFAEREWWRLMRLLEGRTLQYVVFACPNGLLDYVVGESSVLDQLPAHARVVGGGRIQLAPDDAPTLHIDGEHDALLAAAQPDRLAAPYGLPTVAAYYRRVLGAAYTVAVFTDVTAIGTKAEERVAL